MPQVLTQALSSIKMLAIQVRNGQVKDSEVAEKMEEIVDRIKKDLKSENKPAEKKEPKKKKDEEEKE